MNDGISTPGARYGTLVFALAPVAKWPLATVAAMVVDLNEIQRIPSEGNRFKRREKQRIPLMKKWQKGRL